MTMEQNLVIPNHIAIILDGNGRWAKERNLPRKLGHKAGCETLEQIVEDCARLGVGYLTVYAFSTENWKRSTEEVGALMSLFRIYLKKILKVAMDNNVRVRMIGENRPQEVTAKAEGLARRCAERGFSLGVAGAAPDAAAEHIPFHLIGQLQSN